VPGRTSGVKMVGMAEVRAPITPDGWQSIHTVGTSACIIFILHQKKQSPTHTYRGHQSSLICLLHILRSTASSLFNLHAWQSFSTISKFSLIYLLAWHPQRHTPYISSPTFLLFTAHAHTIATCFAVVVKLCHLILVSLSTLYLELYLEA